MSKRVKRILSVTLIISMIMISSLSFGVKNVQASSELVNVYVEGEFNYKVAQYILEYTNKERTKRGLSKLEMDSSLTESAMVRASELSILVSEEHERPNGLNRGSINSKIEWENAQEHYDSAWYYDPKDIAKDVVESWMSSETHKKGILTSKFKSVGIGVFYADNTWYSIQEFSSSSATTVCKKTTVKKAIKKISTKSEYVTKKYSSLYIQSKKIYVKEKTNIQLYHSNPYGLFEIQLNPKTFKFTSSNTSVAKVNSKGVVTGKKAGTTTITVKIKGTSTTLYKFKIKVKKSK
jgi:uncharacterized protein YkwD